MDRITIQSGIDAFKSSQLPNSNVVGTNLLIQNMAQETSTHKVQTVIRQGIDLTEIILANTLTKDDDIIDNLVTSDVTKALSANQGVAIKTLIDSIINAYGQPNGTARLDGNGLVPPSQLPLSTEVIRGIVRLATISEANALTLNTVAVSPANLPSASTIQKGIVRLATPNEAAAGTLTNVAVSPADLAAFTLDGLYAPVVHTHTSSNITDFSPAVTAIIDAKYPTQSALSGTSNAVNLSPATVNTTPYGFSNPTQAALFFDGVTRMNLRILELESRLQALDLIL